MRLAGLKTEMRIPKSAGGRPRPKSTAVDQAVAQISFLTGRAHLARTAAPTPLPPSHALRAHGRGECLFGDHTQGGGPSRWRGTGLALGYYLPPLRGFRLRLRNCGGQVGTGRAKAAEDRRTPRRFARHGRARGRGSGWRDPVLLGILLAVAASCSAAAAEPPRSGRVEFSNGETLTGGISLSPGSELKLHAGDALKVLALDRVQQIELSPEKESLEQNYRFIEAGKAIKETEGQPYPMRLLSARIILAGGQALSGHLYTTVLYVEGEANVRKVILPAKQRGQQGQTLKDLVYPVRITFDDAALAAPAAVRLRLKLPGVGPSAGVAALVRGSLVRLEVKSAGPGEYLLASPLGKEVFLAVEAGRKVLVGWPRQSDPDLVALVRKTMPETEDFFDRRDLLGAFRDDANADVYSLVLAARLGKTTLEQTRSQPWRVEIYRWKLDPEGRRLMLAGQDYLFRGIEARGHPPPTVELDEALWKVRKSGDVWEAISTR